MTIYPINEAETIFEPFYDSGESYPDYEKYTPLQEYTVTYAEGTIAAVEPSWAAVYVKIEFQKTDGYAVKMARACALEIRGYDILRIFAMIDRRVKFRIQCVIDGETVTAWEGYGLGDSGEYDGKIGGNRLTHLSLEFCDAENSSSASDLNWIGLANSEKQAAMEAKPSPYDGSWEGCFVEDPEIKPMIGVYFDEEELKALRQRLNREPFATITNQLREKAKKAMTVEPEPYITDYLPRHDRRWVRNRDMVRPVFQEDMHTLALIGLLDQDLEMLRMACRKLLSVAVTPRWTESIMGCLPGATWHHRSFTEGDICSLCALTLDWAGSLLTWHGKNIVYDALMQKGLPRLEADFHTMEYIRWMNQGIIFNGGRVLALLALADRYPRYEARLQDAARDEREMIDNYVYEDGGTIEGASYWNNTFSRAISTVYLLARHEHKTLEEYAWDKLKKTGRFALGMLSDWQDGSYCIPFNDAHTGQYNPVIYSGFARINSDDPRWQKLYSRVMADPKTLEAITLEALLLSDDLQPAEGEIHSDGFASFDTIGHTSLRRTTEDVGRIHCFVSGGPTIFAHSHGDRGQFLLEVDHTPMLIDRGICNYSYPQVTVLGNSRYHNVFYPEAEEGQPIFEQLADQGEGSRVLFSTYEGGTFRYCTDTLGSWAPGIFTAMTRRIKSEDPHLYLIYDDVTMVNELAASFRLNTRGEVRQLDENRWAITQNGYQITVTPVNYTVTHSFCGEDGVDEHIDPVNMLRLYLPKAKEHPIVTLLEVSKIGAQKAKVLSENAIDYNGKIYTV